MGGNLTKFKWTLKILFFIDTNCFKNIYCLIATINSDMLVISEFQGRFIIFLSVKMSRVLHF